MPASAIRQFALSTSVYAPIVTPIDCNYFLIIGNADGTAMIRSSDGTDGNSYTMPSGGWYSMLAPRGRASHSKIADVPRYPAGSPVTFMKAVSGIGPVIVEFVL